MLDFIRGGCEVSLIVAVDFTASNANPQLPSSLHYGTAVRPSEYERAIRAVGAVLNEYDSDKRYPVYGFGAAFNNATHHCFPLTFDLSNPEVEGVEGICGVYRTALSCVTLSGPTYFAEVLNTVAELASLHASQVDQKYFVLLLLTDGVVNDMDASIDAIVRASALPLSIIIVGVGTTNFEDMHVLDADDVPLRSRGVVMQRDIVQFVAFRDVEARGPAALARVRGLAVLFGYGRSSARVRAGDACGVADATAVVYGAAWNRAESAACHGCSRAEWRLWSGVGATPSAAWCELLATGGVGSRSSEAGVR